MPERNCSTCVDVQKRMWGCSGGATMPVELFGEEQTTCPRRPVLDHPELFSYWMRLYKNYKRGFLPEEGALLDQAAGVLDVFDIFDALYADIQEFRDKEQKRKQLLSGQGAQGPGRGRLTSR